MKNDPIVINEAYLHTLQTTYAGQVDDIDGMYGKVYAFGSLPESHVDMTQPLTLRLGGSGFTEAQELGKRIDGVRSGVAARFKSGRGELYTLEYGIKFLLADSDATEQLSTLSSEQWEYFMPTSSGS